MAEKSTSPKCPRLFTWPAVPLYVRNHIRRVVHFVPQVIDIRHSLNIYLLPTAFWLHWEQCQEVVGEFHTYHGSGKPSILLAGVPYDFTRRKYITSEPDALRQVSITLLHELSHYEQFRDGKRQIETGVDRRAEVHYRKIEELINAKK
jgi:hypothetical protein